MGDSEGSLGGWHFGWGGGVVVVWREKFLRWGIFFGVEVAPGVLGSLPHPQLPHSLCLPPLPDQMGCGPVKRLQRVPATVQPLFHRFFVIFFKIPSSNLVQIDWTGYGFLKLLLARKNIFGVWQRGATRFFFILQRLNFYAARFANYWTFLNTCDYLWIFFDVCKELESVSENWQHWCPSKKKFFFIIKWGNDVVRRLDLPEMSLLKMDPV